MTPQEEKKFFDSLESKYEWRKDLQPQEEATILRQEDFEFVLGVLATHIPQTPERDALLTVLINSHRDLLRLFLDIKGILDNKPEEK
jgi:hypothetical protein